MAEKADLMIEAAKKSEEISRLEAAIEKSNEDLRTLPQRYDRLKREAREKSLASFNRRQEELRARVEGVVAQKRQAVVELVDTFPGLETKEFAGRFEVRELEEHLKEVYPAEMVDNYICMDPIEMEDDEEAFRLYSSVESSVMSLSRGGGFVSRVFNGVTAGLTSLGDNPGVGLKIIPAVLLFYCASIFFFPFLFLTVFTVIGCTSAVQGAFIKGLLRKLYSVKLFLNSSYDEDIFAKDRDDILAGVDDYLEDAKVQYLNVINQREFQYDANVEKKLDRDQEVEKRRLEQTRDLNNTTLQKMREELEAIVARIEELEEAEKKKAEHARVEYLETITWKREWLQRIFVDVTSENKVLLLPYTQGNSLYYAQDIGELKDFSRLVTFQGLLHMHPEYASQVVLDYKYMGGALTQFSSLKGKCLKICYSDEDIRKQQELINNEIKGRTNNILSSSANLDEFNTLMSSYGSTGEYYVIVHLFGLEALNATLLNWFRNGPRVGYLFKFYWTVEELQTVKEAIPFADIQDYFELRGNPIARTAASVKRIVGIDS